MAGSSVEEVFVLTARDNTQAAFASVKNSLKDMKKAFAGIAAGAGAAGLSELASGSREAAHAFGALSAAMGFLAVGSPILAGIVAITSAIAYFVSNARQAKEEQEELTRALEDYAKTAQQLATAPFFEKALQATERITELEEQIADLRKSAAAQEHGAKFFADRASREADALEVELRKMIGLRQNAYDKMRQVRQQFEKKEEDEAKSSLERQNRAIEDEMHRHYKAVDDNMSQLAEGWMKNLGKDKWWEELSESWTTVEEQAAETTDAMSVYADQAARNMQSAFADFLFDPFKDGLDGLLKNFLQVIQRMIAEAAAARIFESLGLGGSGGALNGVLGGLFGKRASGGPVSAGKPYLVGEEGPEMFVPGMSGGIVPNGAMGGGANVVINIDARNAQDPAAIFAAGEVIRRQVRGDMATMMRRGYIPGG